MSIKELKKSNLKSKRENIWVEELGFLDCLTLFIRAKFRDILIHYSEYQISCSGRRLLVLLKRLKLSGNFIAENLLKLHKDSKGDPFVYRMYKDYDFYLNKFCDQYLQDKPRDFKEMAKSYLAYFIYSRILFISAVESEIRLQETQDNIIYLVRHPVNSLLKAYLKDKDYILRESLFSIKSIRFFLRPGYYAFHILLGKILLSKVKTNLAEIRPAIWVEYCRGHRGAFDFTFWRQGINSEDFDIVYYFDRKDSPCNIDSVREIEKKGLKWIDTSLLSLGKISTFNVFELIKLSWQFFFQQAGVPGWFRIFLFEERMWFLIYQSVFTYFKVKIIIQHRDSSWAQEVQVKAIESTGGIMLGFHWSNFLTYRIPTHILPHHVYFVWGKYMYDWAQKRGNTCRYVLPSGLWILQDKQLPKEFDNLAKALKFIIAIFDNTAEKAVDEFSTPTALSNFYLRILSLLENNSFWGGIVKSKHYTIQELGLLPQGEQILKKIQSLISQKRLIMLSAQNSPVTAAIKANLSVCYTLNSAGIISAIHGNRAIHWDCAGVRKNPFYRDAGQKFIYNSLDEFEEAIIKVSRGDPSIGDFSNCRKAANYFEDFSAPWRIGRFIQTYMEEISKTDDSKCALDITVDNYIKENNIAADFFKMSNLWSDQE